jgi:hypothetical protein
VTVRAAEELAILQLQQRYAGKFISPNPSLNSSITLVADHRGLIVEEFISNSTDVGGTLLPKLIPPSAEIPLLQLVPTLLYRNEKEQKGEKWRFVLLDKRAEGDGDIWDDFCVSNVDLLQYAGLPLNELIFLNEGNARVDDLHLTAFRVNLTRIVTDVGSEMYDTPQESMEL